MKKVGESRQLVRQIAAVIRGSGRTPPAPVLRHQPSNNAVGLVRNHATAIILPTVDKNVPVNLVHDYGQFLDSPTSGRGTAVSRMIAGNASHKPAGCVPFVLVMKEFGTRATVMSNGSWDGGEQMADEMIRYSQMNRLKGADEAIRVLEHGLSFLVNDGKICSTSAGRVLLALSSLHIDRANFDDARRVLEQASAIVAASPEVKVAAEEAQSGLSLRQHDDGAAIAHASKAFDIANGAREEGWDDGIAHALRSRALSALALAEHLRGNVNIAEKFFVEANSFQEKFNEDYLYGSAAAVLADAEHCHSSGRLSHASVLYERALHLARKGETGAPYLAVAAIAMEPSEIVVGALAGLGQLAAHSGDYEEAERRLTESLTQAESICGERHPRTGAVLSAMAHVYYCRAKTRASGDRIVAEGLYRRSLELLGIKTQADDTSEQTDMMDLKSLTIARLAEVVGWAPNRSSEAEKLMTLAKAFWCGPQPLAEVLRRENDPQEKVDPSSLLSAGREVADKRYTIIDVRLGRVFL